MKILVTGGAGFIGSNFIRLLINKTKHNIINFDVLSYAGNIENLKDIEKNPRYTFVKGDVANEKDVSKVMKNVDLVFHFAAESHVDRSIEDPFIFSRTNFIGTHVMLEAARRINVRKFVHISCYDEKTRALTTKGLKNFHELKKGDIIFSLNKTTSQLEEKKIKKVIIQDYEGMMMHFKSNRVDLLITPNHNVFYKKSYDSRDAIYVEDAETLSTKTGLKLPDKAKWKGIDKETLSINGIGQVNTSDLFYLSGIFIGDGFIAYQEKKVETKSGLKSGDWLIKARDKSGKFCNIDKQSSYKSICKGYRIFFDIPEKDKARKRLEDTLKGLNIIFSAHRGRAGEHIYFTSKYWMKYFEQFGKYAIDKHIPSWMLKFDKKYLLSLFEGLIDSDGYKRKSDFQYTTISPMLLSSITELGYKLGFRVVYKNNYNKSYINNRMISGNAYYIYFSRQPKGIGKQNVKQEYYKGKIWCVKVEDNKNLIVERNGKFDFCGNTDEVYGSIENGSFSEEDILKPNSPYSASKAAADLLCRSYWKTYQFPVTIVRSTNNFGPYQYPEKLIPLFITNLINGKKVPLYGDGKNIRDWIFVLDNCEAIRFASENGKAGEIYNIGAGNEKSNLDITRIILRHLGKSEDMIEYVNDRLGHDKRYSLDCSKLKKLGWKPKYDFKEALGDTIEWYLSNKDWWKKLIQ